MPEQQTAALSLRPARREDCRDLWIWRNDPRTREASVNMQEIPFDQHERWFSGKIGSPDTRIFILESPAGRGIGYIRFEVKGSEAEVSIALEASERGKGHGSAALRLAVQQLLDSGAIRRITAIIKPSNTASAKVFERAGFDPAGSRTVQGTVYLEMACSR